MIENSIWGPEPVASIVIPSFRGVDRLPALLDSIAAQNRGTPAFEVVVVIDGIDDGSVSVIDAEDRFPIRTILFPENRGRVAALNAGFDDARGEVLIRCDDDLRVPAGFVVAHVRAHESTELVGGIGLTVDVHRSSRYAEAYGADAGRRSHAAARSTAPEGRWRLWAANCSIRRETWERIGPYDTRYRAYGWEDVDYGYRLHEAGIPLQVIDGATADHLGPATSTRGRAQKAYDSGAARATFHRLHPRAPLPAPSRGAGIWGLAVGTSALLQARPAGVRLLSGIADRLLPHIPAPLGRKVVALTVEGAGLAGTRADSAGASDQSDRTSPRGRPRVAIAHDYLTQRGGAERLVLSICRAFPDAEIHTLFYEPDQTYPEYRDKSIRTSSLNRIGPFRRDPRLALPLLAPLASRQRIDADVVVASSSGWAHAFPSEGATVVYCHSPARWLYLPEDYFGEAGRLDPKRLALAVLRPMLLSFDRRAARRADQYLSNSTVVHERIHRVYGIDAPTLFPPFSPDVADGAQESIPELSGWAGVDGTEGGHHLVVSRLQPYKHVDRVIDAFRDLPDQRLLVIGRGPEEQRLRAMAPANVRLVEGLSDAQMRWAYGNARALIAASHEDFGLTPLEAGAHGVPTLALRAGGYLDTVQDGVNGLFFEAAEPSQIAHTVRRSAETRWNQGTVRTVAETFSEARFIDELRDIVAGRTSS